MKHEQFAMMRFANAESMYINAQYITAYAYLREDKKTVITVLGEGKEIYFPGDQTKEIKRALDSDVT